MTARRIIWPLVVGCVAGTLAVATPLPDPGADTTLPIEPMVISDGHAARWDTCEVTYSVNPTNAPTGAVDDFVTAAKLVTAATGVVFTRSQDTTATFNQEQANNLTGDDGQPDLLVTWAAPQGAGGKTVESDLLEDESVAAKTEVFTSYRRRFGFVAAYHHITGSTITFNANESGAGGKGGQMAFALHELGHVLGLGHTDMPDSMMNVYGTLDRTKLTALDKFHLRTVSPAHCYTR